METICAYIIQGLYEARKHDRDSEDHLKQIGT